ncbi:MAG: manganese efflux pump [Candidatus Aminicenantes bacterium]|nr:manganese efflux pump [Candidatus Aminicenantes bacterium]
MSIFLILGIAFALAMDAFAVSLGISTALGKMTRTQRLRLAFYFGFFQFLMPILGWSAGQGIQEYIQSFDHWVAHGLLLLIGGKMIYESFGFGKREKKYDSDPTKGLYLLLLSVATSIDALAVGLSIALLGVGIIYPAVVIGLVAFALTLVGLKVGAMLGNLVRKRGELLGGVVLILIGVIILFEHL